MEVGRLARVRISIDGLSAFQSHQPRYLAMSLCDLATHAKRLLLRDLQLELTTRAVEVNPRDGWAWAQHADALLNNGQLEDALSAYETAGLYGQRVALTGRAYILKALGRLDDSLELFDQAVVQSPDDPFARNGRAETLRAMNRLDDALTAYDETLALYPSDVVTRNGRAETLRAMNRLDDALAAYDEALALYPNDVVTRNGRAETLRAMNRLDEALAAYDETLALYPNDVVTRNGRAETLKAMDRLQDALSAFQETMESFRTTGIVGFSGRQY